MAPKDLEEYVTWVLDQHPENVKLDPEVRQQLEKDYVSSLEDQVNAAVLSALPQAELATFEQLVESGTDAQVQEFTEMKVPHLSELVAEILVRFRISYLGA